MPTRDRLPRAKNRNTRPTTLLGAPARQRPGQMLEEKGDDAGMADSMVSLPRAANLQSLAKVLYWSISGGELRLLQHASACFDVRAPETGSTTRSSAACHTSPVSLDTAIFSFFLQQNGSPAGMDLAAGEGHWGGTENGGGRFAERERRWRCRATPGSCGTLRSSAS